MCIQLFEYEIPEIQEMIQEAVYTIELKMEQIEESNTDIGKKLKEIGNTYRAKQLQKEFTERYYEALETYNKYKVAHSLYEEYTMHNMNKDALRKITEDTWRNITDEMHVLRHDESVLKRIVDKVHDEHNALNTPLCKAYKVMGNVERLFDEYEEIYKAMRSSIEYLPYNHMKQSRICDLDESYEKKDSLKDKFKAVQGIAQEYATKKQDDKSVVYMVEKMLFDIQSEVASHLDDLYQLRASKTGNQV